MIEYIKRKINEYKHKRRRKALVNMIKDYFEFMNHVEYLKEQIIFDEAGLGLNDKNN